MSRIYRRPEGISSPFLAGDSVATCKQSISKAAATVKSVVSKLFGGGKKK
jgi:hypothetical protein